MLQDLEASAASGVEDLRGGEGLDVAGGSHLDISDYEEEDCEAECFQAAEDVGEFGHGGLDDGWDIVRTCANLIDGVAEKMYH